MRGHHTIPRKFYPVRIQKKYLRTIQGKNRRTSTGVGDDSVAIALKDLGDVDAKELNTIPNSIAEEEVVSWEDVLDMSTGQCAPCPIPLFQVNSAKFCPVCTVDLVKIHENNSNSDSSNDVVNTSSSFEQAMMSILEGFGENMPTSADKKCSQVKKSKEKNETSSTKKHVSKNQFLRGMPPEDTITCSMSELSMQGQLCSSESTICAVISEAVQTKPSLCVRTSTSDKKSKLKLLCGELLMHLCKTAAESAVIREAADQTFPLSIKNSTEDSLKVPNTNSQDQKQSDQISSTPITQQSPEWLQKITREKSKSQHSIHQKPECSFQGNTVRNKAPSKRFKPLLCTKLSVPWNRKHLTQSYTACVKPQTKMNFTGHTTIYTNSNTTTKSVSSRTAVDNSEFQLSEPLPNKMNNHSVRNRDLKPKQELVKIKNKEFEEPEVCSKCRNNTGSIPHSKITMKPSKGRRDHPHNRSSKRLTRMPKEKRAKRHMRKGTVSKDSVATKYFIRSFFTDTSSAMTPKTESDEKTFRNLAKKRDATREKSTFTLPHHVTVGQDGFNFTKRKHEQEGHIRQLPGKIVSKDDVITLLGKELRTINKRVKAQEKHIHETTAPMFHTCFKQLLSKNRIHVKKPNVSHREHSHHKKPKDINHVFTFPKKMEKRLNDHLFSCFIPRAFK